MSIKCWAIALTEDVSGPINPVFYYNDVRDTWVRDFQGGCAFYDEESAQNKLKELNIHADVVQGSVL